MEGKKDMMEKIRDIFTPTIVPVAVAAYESIALHWVFTHKQSSEASKPSPISRGRAFIVFDNPVILISSFLTISTIIS